MNSSASPFACSGRGTRPQQGGRREVGVSRGTPGSCPGSPAQTRHHHSRAGHPCSATSQALKRTEVLHDLDFAPLNSVGTSAGLPAQLSAWLWF